MKKQMALYQENLEEQIGTGVVCQEVAIVKENSDGVFENADKATEFVYRKGFRF